MTARKKADKADNEESGAITFSAYIKEERLDSKEQTNLVPHKLFTRLPLRALQRFLLHKNTFRRLRMFMLFPYWIIELTTENTSRRHSTGSPEFI
jgi:hypothetical protein